MTNNVAGIEFAGIELNTNLRVGAVRDRRNGDYGCVGAGGDENYL